MSRIVVLCISAFLGTGSAAINSGRWTAAPVNVDQILQGNHMEVIVKSQIQCAQQALAAEGAVKVYCYDGSRCIIASEGLGDLRGPATAGWKCKSKVIECKSPFNSDPVLGCFMITSTQQDRPSSAALCASYEGGSLYSPATDAQMTAMSLYLQRTILVPKTFVWMGISQIGGVWHFADGRDVAPGLWCSGEPNSGSTACGMIRYVTSPEYIPCNFWVSDTSCTALGLALCQISPVTL